MSKERVSIRMTPHLRDEIDAVRERTGESRNGFIEAACHERLERLRSPWRTGAPEEGQRALIETHGGLTGLWVATYDGDEWTDDEGKWADPSDVQRWMPVSRVRSM